MRFSDIIEHKEIAEKLRGLIDSKRLPNTLLFTEQPGAGALSLALATISYIFCKERNNGDSCGKCPSCSKTDKLVHPDVHFIFPINTSSLVGKGKRAEVDAFYPLWREIVLENPNFTEQQLYKKLGIENKFGSISVNEASAIMKKLSLSSYEGGAKIMLILFAERMNQEAANKLLKSLEEPNEGTYYFLISQNPGRILPTVLSRCMVIEVPKVVHESEIEYFDTFVSLLSLSIKKDMLGLIDLSASMAEWGREEQKEFCLQGMELLRKIHAMSVGVDKIAYCSAEQSEKLKKLSGYLKKEIYRKGYESLNNAITCIERNVNPKFIFCDLCNRFYYNA